MKKLIYIMSFSIVLLAGSVSGACAQIPVAEVVKAGLKKVIRAVDLKVQRLQNETLALQNTQKALENNMSKLKLAEIAAWIQRQQDLYQTYYNDLRKVKEIIAFGHRVHQIEQMETDLAVQYIRIWKRLGSDPHFSEPERRYMAQVYSGMLEQASQNVAQLLQVVEPFSTTMSDGERLQIINRIAARVQIQYNDMCRFNTENMLLSLHRAKDASEAQIIKQVYGL